MRPESDGGKAIGDVGVGGESKRDSNMSDSSDGSSDDRLNPNLRQKIMDRRRDERVSEDLRDDEDYSRPVLGVRNMPDGASLASVSNDS